MWISEYMTGNSFSQDSASVGEIRASSGGKVCVSASVDYTATPVIAPFGIVSVPTQGTKTLILPTESGSVCLGAAGQIQQGMEPGELMLFSAGGASIVLKNDGRVLINGRAVE